MICDVAGSGERPRKIIVGAHFDSVGGDGIIDNWSGAVLLPSLSEFLRERPRRHTFEFVGFPAEEKGLLGSRAYLNSISKEDRAQIAAVITMDSIGLTPTKFWPKRVHTGTGRSRRSNRASAQVGLSGCECRPSWHNGFPSLQRGANPRFKSALGYSGDLENYQRQQGCLVSRFLERLL
jgi:hypothetical protein